MKVFSLRAGLFAIFAACVALFLSDVAQIALFRAAPEPLLSSQDWLETDGFFSAKLTIKPLETPAGIAHSPLLETWRSWEPRNGGHIGKLVSSPFKAPQYMAIPYTGFAGETAGTLLQLRCSRNGKKLEISSGRTNTQWATIYLDTRGFCEGKVQLVAQASSKQYYVGVGTPFSVSRSTYLANTSYAPRLIAVILTVTVFGSWGAWAASLVSSSEATRKLAWAFLAGGCVAMVTLGSFMISQRLGIIVASVAALLGPCGLAGCWFFSTSCKERIQTFLPVLIFWFAVSVVLTALVSAIDIGAGSWTANGIFTPLRWSSDNQLSMLLSEAMWKGIPPVDVRWGRWLASDRTPLLAAMLMVVRAPFAVLVPLFGSTVISYAYEAAAITLLASWAIVAAVFLYVHSNRYLVISLIFAVASPFLLFNTVYVWPKILGGTYAVVVFLLLREANRKKDKSIELISLIGCCAVLSILSHASNAFVLVPLALWHLRDLLRFGLVKLSLASLFMLMVMLPWGVWTQFLQPHGTALIHYAVSGKPGFNVRTQPLLTSVVDAYHLMTFPDWLSIKGHELLRMVGLGPSWQDYHEVAREPSDSSFLGRSRVQDFYSVGRALMFPALAYCLSFSSPLRKRWSETDNAVVIGGFGVGLVLFVTLLPSYVHHMPYGAMLLIVLAGGASVVLLSTRIAIFLTVIAWLYLAIVWIVPLFWIADRLRWSGFLGIALAIPLACAALALHSRSKAEEHR